MLDVVTNEAESWLPDTKRSKRSKGRSTNKNGDCRAHLRQIAQQFNLHSFNMYYVSAKDLSHLCKCLRPMTDPVFFIR